MHISTRALIIVFQIAAVASSLGITLAPFLKTRQPAPKKVPALVPTPVTAPAHEVVNDLIENIFDAHALPVRGDRVFIVLDKLTGELTSKMGVFAGFGTLPDGGTDGEVRVGHKKICLKDCVWLTCPDLAVEMPDVFAAVVGFVREEYAMSTIEDYELPWSMHRN